MKRVLCSEHFSRETEEDACRASLGSSEDFEWQPRPLRDVPLKSILSVSITGRLSPFVNRSGLVSGTATLPNEPVAISSHRSRRIRIADLSGGGEERRPIFRVGLPVCREDTGHVFQKQTCKHRRKFITPTESARSRYAARFSLTTSYKVFTGSVSVSKRGAALS